MKIVLFSLLALTAGVFFSTEIKSTVSTKTAEAANYIAKTTSEQAAKLSDATKTSKK